MDPLPDFERVAAFAIKNRLPAIGITPAYVRAGLLMSYGPNALDQYRHAAMYVGKILKGAKPADLPVEQPTKFELDELIAQAEEYGVMAVLHKPVDLARLVETVAAAARQPGLGPPSSAGAGER